MPARPRPSSEATATYLRQARRIRAQRLSPSARQAALKAIAPKPAAPTRSTPSRTVITPAAVIRRKTNGLPPLLSIAPETAEKFANEVGAFITGGILRFTARRQLIARAGRMGIPAFEANLLIASVLQTQRPSTQPLLQQVVQREISAFHVAATITLLTSMLAVLVFA